MSTSSKYRLGIVSAVAVLTLLVAGEARVVTQSPAVWQFETVAEGNLIPGCVSGMTLAGFEYGADGRPVLAWREENGCGGKPRIYWTRQDAGQWTEHEFLSARRYGGGAEGDDAHQLSLRPSDGKPFLLYADVGPSNSINTYLDDLDVGFVPSEAVEGLVGSGECAGVNYSPAFGPLDATPQWSTDLAGCNNVGPIKLNSMHLSLADHPRSSLAIGADGTRHVLWINGGKVFYTRWLAAAPAPDATIQLFDHNTTERPEAKIAIDVAGTLHALVRGPDISADWDLGAIVYLQSIDGGSTWSPWEYVDSRDPQALWNANTDMSLAVDADGVPAVTYWRGESELYYVRRDGPGTWTRQLVTSLPIGNPLAGRPNQLRFDPNGQPVIAFFDPVVGQLRLAHPLPTNRPPVAVYDHVDILFDGSPTTIDVVANDTDPDGDLLEVDAIVTPPQHGDATIVSASSISYQPSTFSGTDFFTYRVRDGYGGTSTASVTLSVAVPTTPTTTTTTVSSAANPSDTGQPVTFTATVAAVGAVATPAGEVSFVFVPTNTTLATIGLVGGTASFETSALSEGTFDVQAIFTGNAFFASSTATLTQVVVPAATPPIRNGIAESRPPFNGVGMILPSATHNACTATLISPFIVLTAAQCLRDDSPDPVFEFSLGAGRTARLTDIRVHPVFNTGDGINLAFDVALASLDRAVAASWTDTVPATLRTNLLSPVVDATAIGFGETSAGAGSGRRTSGTLRVTDYLAGEDQYFNPVPQAFLETNPGSAANQMFCPPGAGGPLFYDGQVVGVASFRFVATCAEAGPGYYVTVSRLADWIQTTANELGNHPPSTNIGDDVMFEGIAILRRIIITDPDHDAVQFTVEGLPPGLIQTPFSAGEHELPHAHMDISGAPSAGSAGSYPGTFTMNDGTVTVVKSFVWTVRPPNREPVAQDDAVTVVATPSLTIPVLANDSDPDGDPITVTGVTTAAFGTVQTEGQSLVYRPGAFGWFTDTFSYTIDDGHGGSATARVTVRILSPEADLTLALNPSTAVVEAGQAFAMSIVATNQGSVPIAGVVTLDLPAEVALAATSLPPVSTSPPHYPLGALAAGESKILTLQLVADDLTGVFPVRAAVVSDDAFEPTGNNTVLGSVTVQPDFCFAPRMGLRGFWRFEGNLDDLGGRWRANGHVTFGPSRIGAAAVFADDGQSYVAFDPNAALRFPRFTLAAWTRRSAEGDANAPVISDRSRGPFDRVEGPYWFGFQDGYPVLVLHPDDGGEPATIRAPHQAPVDTWTHIGATYDGAVARLFVNGVEVAHANVVVSISGNAAVSFGEGFTFVDESAFETSTYLGLLDDVAIYDRSLSAGDIHRMLAGDAVACAAPTSPSITVALSASPSLLQTNGLVTFEATVTNTGDGYLTAVQVAPELDPDTTLIDASPAFDPYPTWNVGPMLAGESRQLAIRAFAPPVDGHFLVRATATDLETGVSATAELPYSVAPAMCFVPSGGLVTQWSGGAWNVGEEPGRVGGVALGNSEPSPLMAPAFSLGGWVNLQGDSAPQRPDAWSVWELLFVVEQPGSPFVPDYSRIVFGAYQNVPTLRLRRLDGSAVTVAAAGVTITRRQWQHLMATFDGSVARIYLDGVVVAEEVVGALMPFAEGEVLHGGPNLSDELTAYTRALGAEDVAAFIFGTPGCQINERPKLQNPGRQQNHVGDTVSLQLEATDTDAADTLVFSAAGLPEGLSLDPRSGFIAGVIAPEASRSRRVTITASDGRLAASEAFDWTIEHQFTITVGRGAQVLVNGVACDARAAETTCSWPFADGEHVSLSVEAAPDLTNLDWWLEENGEARNHELSSGGMVITRSRTLRFSLLASFKVTIEGVPIGVVLSYADVLGASIPIVAGFGGLRDAMSCTESATAPQCIGRAALDSTVTLAGLDHTTTLFERFSGDCQGASCAVTLDRPGHAVTVHYRPAPMELTLQAGSNAVVRLTDLTHATEYMCEGGASGRDCVVSLPYGTRVQVTSASPGGWSHWRWTAFGGSYPDDSSPIFTVYFDQWIALRLRSAVTVNIEGRTWNGLGQPPVNAISSTSGESVPLACVASTGSTTCVGTAPAFHQIYLHTAGPTASFIGWSGACSSTDPFCYVRTDTPAFSATASYGWPLTLNVGAGGQARANQLVCDGGSAGAACVSHFPEGETVIVRATGNAPAYSLAWADDAGHASAESEFTVAMDAAKTLSLTFIAPFAVHSSWVAPGVITAQLPASPHAQFAGPIGGAWYGLAPVGSTVTLTAHPPAGYSFAGWSADCQGLGSCAVVINRDNIHALAAFSQVPTASPASVTTTSDRPVDITVTGTDPEGDPLTAELSSGNPIGGQVVRTGPMSFRFTPNPTFTGEGFFYFRLTDGYGFSASAIAIVQVTLPAVVRVDIVERITVTDSVAVSPAVMVNVVEQIHVTDSVVATSANTPVGVNVTAPATGPHAGTSPISVTFPTVTQPGNTTYITQQGAFMPPDGFRFGTPPVTFDISTTAQYTAPLRVCVNYGATVYQKPATLRLFHYEGGQWVDRTVSVNTTTHVVCASVSSLSPFAIAEPEDLEGRMHGDGTVNAGGKELRFDFRIAERRLGMERGRIDLTVKTPKGGKKKETLDEFESTAIDSIRFWDDPAFQPGRWKRPRPQSDSAVFTGTGTWNGKRGYTFDVRATDEGEPGRGRDRLTVTIRDPQGAVVATVDGVLIDGNIQSERLRQEHWR